MPTPFLSRAVTSDHSPVATVERRHKESSSSPINWDTNVFSFVTDCRHPGLVRRNSLATGAADHLAGSGGKFRRQHRRNLSAATTVGFVHCPDTPKVVDRSRITPYYPYYNNCHNDRIINPAAAVNLYRPVKYGHTRNISDPIGGREFYRLDSKPNRYLFDAYNFDYSGLPPVTQLSQQFSSSTSPPELLDGRSFSGDLRGFLTPAWDNEDQKKSDPPACLAIQRLVEVTNEEEEDQLDLSRRRSRDSQCLLPCLQSCATPVSVLVGLFCAMFFQTLVVNGLVNSMLTTLERRFNLSTRQIGYMISCAETSGVLTTVGISFVDGRRHNRLRIIGLSALLVAGSFALFAVPHFLIPAYNPDEAATGLHLVLPNSSSLASFPTPTVLPNKPDLLLCADRRLSTQAVTGHWNATECRPVGVSRAADIATTATQYMLLVIFCLAMVLAGVGASPVHVLGPTYLWDNFTAKEYPIYSAIFYSAGGLGPACGFLAGAGFLSVYIDSPWTLPRPGLDRNSPLWLGAWWLGMLTCSLVTLLVAVPVVAFPKRLDRPDRSRATNPAQPAAKETEAELIEPPHPSPVVLQKVSSLCSFQMPYSSPNLRRTLPPTATSTSNSMPRSSRVRPAVGPAPRPPHPASDQEKRATSESILPPASSCLRHSLLAASLRRMASSAVFNSSSNQPSRASRRHPAPPEDARSAMSLEKKSRVDELQGAVGEAEAVTGSRDPVPVGRSWRCQLLEKCKDLVAVIRRVLTNPVWLGVTFTSVVEHTIVAAFLTYAAKYLQELFQVPAYLASVHTGAVVVPSSVLGVLAGAVLMRHFRPSIAQTLVGVWLLIAGTVCTTVVLMCLGCSSNRVAGLTADYSGQAWPWQHGPASLVPANLTAPCNRDCQMTVGTRSATASPSTPRHCSPALFHPVCWRQHQRNEQQEAETTRYLTFFNPCFAGCRSADPPAGDREPQRYSECTCVSDHGLNPHGLLWTDEAQQPGNSSAFGHVTAGRCATDCPQHFVFLVVLFVHILFTGMLQNPSNVITLSCVDTEDSSVGLGLQIFFTRTLAYIPAPIYFGQLFDSVCQFRLAPEPESVCPLPGPSENLPGACQQYNLDGLPLVWLGTVLAFKVISLVGCTLTWHAARSKARKDRLQSTSDPVCCPEKETQPRTTDVRQTLEVATTPDTVQPPVTATC